MAGGRRKEPEGWLMRLRTQGPGAMHPQSKGPRQRRAARDERPEKPDKPAELDPVARKNVAAALKSIVKAYPFGLLAAHIGPQDLDMVVQCPTTDLALIAELVKQRLMPTIRTAGLGGRFWRKGFLRRALGTKGEVRRALVLMRSEARIRHGELIDQVRHDESLGVRTRRPAKPIE